MERGRDRTFIRYTNLSRHLLRFRVRPFVTLRWFHALRRGDDPSFEALQTGPGSLSVRAQGGAPCVHLGGSGWRLELRPDWYWNFHRRVELARGFDATEDAFAPGDFVAEVAPGHAVTLQLTADELQSASEVDASLARFDARSVTLVASAADPLEQRLRLAADQVLVHRGPSLPGFTPEPNTVIAGYPWFGDWGRDTLIRCPGSVWRPAAPRSPRQSCSTTPSSSTRAWSPTAGPTPATNPSTTPSTPPSGTSTPWPPTCAPRMTPKSWTCWPRRYSRSSNGTSAAPATASTWIPPTGC